jgi:predicted PurR-regulated permease PerM
MLVIGALYWGRSVLLPLALAALFTFILTPAVVWLERHHLSRLPAVLVVVALVFAVLGALGYGLSMQMGQLADQLPQYSDTIKAKVNAVRESGPGPVGKLIGVIKDVTGSVEDVNQAAEASGVNPGGSGVVVTPGPDLKWLTSFAGSAAEVLASAALVIVLVVFMLTKREDLRNRIIRLMGRGHLTATTRALDEAAQRISRYLLMLVLINAGYGTILSLGLYLIGVPYALLWGFLAASLRFIPYLGIWVGAAFPILLSAATAPGWLQPLLVLGLIAALEVFVANVAEPILYGRSMGVSEVALLVTAAFWAWLWGPVGLILAVPMTVCLAVLGKYVPQLEFFEVLLRDEQVLALPVRYYQRLLARDEDEAADAVEDYLRDHPWESLFDDVLMPALALARRDREGGELGPDEEQGVYQATREVLDDLGPGPGPKGDLAPVSGLAFPAHDEADELMLHMLGRLLEPSGCRLEVLSPKSLTAEAIQRAGELRPTFVVVAALPPGGLAPARHLCKRLRTQCTNMKLYIIRWGQADNLDALREGLRRVGADGVVTTLREAQAQLVPLVQVAAHDTRAAPVRQPAAAAG